MPQYEVEVPGYGKYRVESPTPLTDDQAYAAIQDQLVKRPEPKTGLGAAVGKGIESLISSGRTALGALTGSPEEAAQAGLERGRQIGEKYADQVSLDKLKKVYEERGILPAAGEALSQVPAAIAEQVPNLVTMFGGAQLGRMATARLGAMAGAPFGPIGGVVGGVAGAVVPSLIQQFGGNIERQAQEGAPISVGRAGAAAVPQAALDVASQVIPFGGRLVQKLTGIPTAAFFSKNAAQAEKLANERLLTILAKGTAVGAVAEIPTEVAQQMLERAQAGLSLSSPDAWKEYGETMYQSVLLAPLGAVGRLSERAGSRMDVEARRQEEAAKAAAEQQQQQAEQAAKEQAALADPAYAKDLKQRYTDANIEMQRLNAVVKELGANKDPLSVEDTKDAKRARNDYAEKVMKPLVEEIRRVRPLHPGFDFRPTAAAPAAPTTKQASETPVVPTTTQAPAAPAAPTTAPTGAATSAAPETKPGEVAPEVAAPVDELEVLRGKQAAPAVEAMTTPRAKKAKAAAPEAEEAIPDDLVESYVEALMGDPDVAAEIVKSNQPIEGLDAAQQAAVIEELNRRLAQLELTGGAPTPPKNKAAAPESRVRENYWRPNPYAPTDETSWQDKSGFIHYELNAVLPNGKATVTRLINKEQVPEISLVFTDSKGNQNRRLTVGFNQAGKPYWSARDLSDENIRKNIGDTLFNSLGDSKIASTEDFKALSNRIRAALNTLPVAAPTPAEKKPRAKKAKAEVPAVEDTTVEPTEPKTLEEAFQPTPIEEEPRTDEGQLQIPGTEPPTKQLPLTRTGSGISPEALRDVQAELKRLSKEFISARQEGRKNDARAILERMRYLRSQGVSDEMGPQIRGAIEVPGTQTLTAPSTSPTSTAGVRAEISRIQSTVDLTDQQAALLDRIDDNLSSLSEYRPEITAFLTSLRQRRPAPEVVGRWHPEPEVEQFLQQQVAAIEQKAQQQVTPRELNGMLAKTAKLPLSGKERGLLKLIGENQSPIMGDAEARRIVANWLIQDVGQGVGAATDTLRSYFGIAQEQKAQVSPLSKSITERSRKIETEYEEAKQALEKASADAGVPLQALGSSVQRIETQVARAQAAVRAAEDKVNTATTAGAKKVAATGLANRQNALNELTQKLAAANKDYREQQQKLIAESPQVKAASERFENARQPKRLLDIIDTSDSAGTRQKALKALNTLMPLPKTEAGMAREKVTAPAVQTDMFAEELAPAQVEKTVEEGRAAQREATKKSEEREEEARKKREREAELAALPGQRMSFEKRQEMLRKIDEAPLKRQALQDRANDGNLSQEERDAAQEKLTAYLEDLRQKAEKKDKTYGTKYRIRGEKSALVQELKTRLEATDLTEAQRNKLQEQYRKAQRELVERDNELARLRGVEISPIETPEQRLETLERLHRETYGQAVSDEQQELLDKTKGRALGPVTRKELQPAKVFYTGEEGSKDETEKRTYTRPDMRLTEARGTKQRDVEISKEEMKESNKYEQYRKERRSEQEQALSDYKNQVDAAIQKISDLNAKLEAIKERQAALDKRRSTAQWTQAQFDALNAPSEAIQKELGRAKEDLARLANQEADAAKGDVIDEAQRAELKKYEDYLEELRKRVPEKDRKRILVMYRGVRTPAEEVIAKVSETVQRLKEDLYGSYYGETGETKLSKEARAELKATGRLRGVSGLNDTPLSDTDVELLVANDLTTVLQRISERSANPVARRVAAKLAPVIEVNGVTSRVVEETARNNLVAPGSISTDGLRIRINQHTGLSEETVLHESAHAATMFELEKPDLELTPEQLRAKKELIQMHKQVRSDPTFDNNVIKEGDIHEFVAEGLSSRAVQAYMRENTWDGRSFWRRFADAILRLIGVKTPAPGPMSDRFLDLAENFIRANDGLNVAQAQVIADAVNKAGADRAARYYHGSPTGDIKAFRGIVHLTPNKGAAEKFANRKVFMTAQTGGDNPSVYSVNFDTSNTLDLRKPEHRAKYEVARKEYNRNNPDNPLPVLHSEGFIHSKTGVPSFGYVQSILEALPEFNSVFIDDGAIHNGLTVAARADAVNKAGFDRESFNDELNVAQAQNAGDFENGRLRLPSEELGLYARAGNAFDLNGFDTYSIGSFGPVKKAAFTVKNFNIGLTLDILDMDLVAAGNKPSRCVVERFWLMPSKIGDWTTAEVHTEGVPPAAAAVLSKYKNSLRRVPVPDFNRDPLIKFDEGAFSKTEIRAAFRALRTIGFEMGFLQNTQTLTIKRATGANPSTEPRRVLNASQIERFRSEGSLVSPKTVTYAPGLEGAGATVDKIISKERGAIDKVRAAAGGWLGLETQFVDRFAGFERLSKTMDSLKGMQMMYYLRMYDQKMNFTAQSVSNGALQRVEKKRGDGRTEYVIESVKGANIKQVVDILKKAPAGSPDAANRLFSLYLAGIRAANKGFDTLHFGSEVTEAQLRQTMADIRATPGLEENFKKAREVYNEYNRNQMNFLAQSGAISKELAARLTQENDYIPFYREQRGAVELLIGGENPIRIGNLTEQPYLHELVGGDRPILDFLTSSVQNTAMITDMALRNLSTRNAAIELSNMKLAQIREGRVADDRTTVRYKVDGKDFYAIIDTDKAGIPADILVKGMQGIPTQMPAVVRMLGLPAKLLRTAVQVSPLYPARQLFRDSLAATVLSGANFTPVLGSLKEIGKSATKDTLERRGITGGQIITGTSEDMSRILKDMLSNRGNLGTVIAKAEALNMEADAATRRAQYNSYIKQGLSEMEATLMSLESMNFNKRGASPSIHMANALIPFFNSQIQGLNVLYKALTGKLPFNERLKIQEKLITRGLMIAAGSLAYAALMQDDEAYKNATPDQKYGNWFVRLPGVDEPVRIPIPFEIGYIFKALPEALYNSMVSEHGSEEAFKALKTIALNTIPGGSSYFVMQAMKPLLEYGFEKSFYTGRDTLSAREKQLLPEQQFRENTTELAKAFGGLGLSPIKVEELVRGYTGTMGLALMQAVSMGIPTGESPEKTAKRLSNYPVVGGAFQPNDAGGIIDAVYEKMLDAKKVQTTVKNMMQEGRQSEARELVQRRGDEFAQGAMADYFISRIRQITALENAVRASDMTGEEKRAKLDETRQTKIKLAEAVRKATDEAKKAA